MTNEEAKKMLKAKLECLKHETSGTDYACNQHLCEGCSLNYEQGNMGEQKEALEMATKALEQQPCKDCISREQAVYVASGYCAPQNIADELRKLPSVTPQPKRGKWIVIRKEYEFMGGVVNEAQGCKCSNCGGIVKFKSGFCPSCGSYNGGEKDGNE